ncbi:hypothetical protein EV126DRAFT_342066 [Verticillium dahliae]|nr:hypothetical protein EV126DRAFT_342066 [Verticillium dahliae]
MNQDKIQNVEQQLYRDRGQFFRGTARIRFANLYFGSSCPRELDERITAELKERFTNEGCLRLEPMHHIPAIINQKLLESCLAASPDVSQSLLLEHQDQQPPELTLPQETTVECLQGLHRVAAGKAYLPRRDWWWTIDLYLEDASIDLKKTLSEEYEYSKNFSDGEIFLKLREYHNKTNKPVEIMFAESRMWGRLTKDKKKDLKQILNHKQILSAFDGLRVMPALFTGFRIDHRLLPMKCQEEMCNYLAHILSVWGRIYGGKRSLMYDLDHETLRLLQLRAPGFSSHDLSLVSRYMYEGKVFTSVQSQDDRKHILTNLQTLPCLIPSLHSFFQDIKYLHPPAKALRQLFPASKFSIREAMWRIFTGENLPENHWLLQTKEDEKEYRWISGTASDQFEYSYQQMWLFAWRHWTELVPECPRKEEGKRTPVPQKPDPRTQHSMAKLASKLGFESEEISQLLSFDPDRAIARETLLKARSPSSYKYEENAFNAYIAQFCQIFEQAKEITRDDPKPCLLVPGRGESLERRCGRVFNHAYICDRKQLFLHNLHNPPSGDASGVSSFGVRVSVFFAFFHKSLPNDHTNPSSIRSQRDSVLEHAWKDRGTAPEMAQSPDINVIHQCTAATTKPTATLVGSRTVSGTPRAHIAPHFDNSSKDVFTTASKTIDQSRVLSQQNSILHDPDMNVSRRRKLYLHFS